MDLLYAGHVGGFVLVSSDSDFTRLATRLQESGQPGLRHRPAGRPPAPSSRRAPSSSTSRTSESTAPDAEPDADDTDDGDHEDAAGSPTCNAC